MPDRRYVSEHTHFMQELLANRPELVAQQRQARLTWWDRRETPAEREALERARVRQTGYVYYNNP